MSEYGKKRVLAIIPARSGSKRIPNKNIRDFLGRPLIAHTIEQALSCSVIDRVIVDTDSEEIADISKKYGAEVPFLRPSHLARDNSRVVHSILYALKKFHREENYRPDYVMILQTTSPLREADDIHECWNVIRSTNATTVLTVCETHPRLYKLNRNNDLILINSSEERSTNMQAWGQRFILNGCFVYIIQSEALLRERRIITKRTKAVICPRWRSVDLDTPESWAMAELLYKNKNYMLKALSEF